MIRKIVITTFALLLGLPVVAEEVDRTIGAAKDGHIDISNIAGSVTVNGWDRGEVRVVGTLGDNVEELVLERKGDKVWIKVKVPKRSDRAISSDLTISVPNKSSLDIGTVSADIRVQDVSGRQGLHTVSGKVDTIQAGANIEVESVSGRIMIAGDNSGGDIDASSVSGDVRLQDVSGEVRATSVSGGISTKEGSFDRAELQTVNGAINFKSGLRKNGRLDVESVNGRVNINFVGEVSADFEIDTFNGGINNCFGPKATRSRGFGPGWELEFTEGAGEGRVRISTLNGGVKICR